MRPLAIELKKRKEIADIKAVSGRATNAGVRLGSARVGRIATGSDGRVGGEFRSGAARWAAVEALRLEMWSPPEVASS